MDTSPKAQYGKKSVRYDKIYKYDNKRLFSSYPSLRDLRKQVVAIHKFSVVFALWIATLKRLVRNEALTKIQPIFFKKGY